MPKLIRFWQKLESPKKTAVATPPRVPTMRQPYYVSEILEIIMKSGVFINNKIVNKTWLDNFVV